MIAEAHPLTSPPLVDDQLAGLLVALDLRQIILLLDANGQPRAKLPPGAVLDVETRALLGAHRAAIVEHLQEAARLVRIQEAELWRLGRLAQAGDAEALAAFLAMLAKYERLEGTA